MANKAALGIDLEEGRERRERASERAHMYPCMGTSLVEMNRRKPNQEHAIKTPRPDPLIIVIRVFKMKSG